MSMAYLKISGLNETFRVYCNDNICLKMVWPKIDAAFVLWVENTINNTKHTTHADIIEMEDICFDWHKSNIFSSCFITLICW